MKSSRSTKSPATTLPFDKFWPWLQAHPNCIVRAGTAEVVLFDDEDLHWHFAAEDDGTVLVQVVRGKKLMGELIVEPSEIAYVQAEPSESEEVLFELIMESETGRIAAYHFVLSHDFDEEEEVTPGRWTH